MGAAETAGGRRAWRVSAWAAAAAFGTYFCMYGFRKPFTAGGYTDADGLVAGLGYKTVLVAAQVFGYTASKFLGIKVVAEAKPGHRAVLLLGLIAAAELALVLFAVTPPPYNLVWLFANGLPLGMVFGLVLGFLEGRRHTEALAAGLCASFVVADGVAKSAGAWLLAAGVAPYWMPAAAGLLFGPPLVLSVAFLARVPPPSGLDIAARGERAPMTRADRRAYYARYATGLTLLVGVYLLVTILRSVRADFAPEIWAGLQGAVAPATFAASESVVAAGVLVLIGATTVFRDNRRGFLAGLALAGAGAVAVGAAPFGLRAGALSPFAFMVVTGVGLYLPYIAVQTTILERLMAMTRDRGTIGYLVSLTDAVGYLGYVGVLLARGAVVPGGDFLPFFVGLCGVVAAACLVLLVPCWRYFATHPATRRATPTPDPVG